MHQNPIDIEYRYFETLARLKRIKRFTRVRNCKVSVFNKKITNFNTNVKKIIKKIALIFQLNAMRETTDWLYCVGLATQQKLY